MIDLVSSVSIIWQYTEKSTSVLMKQRRRITHPPNQMVLGNKVDTFDILISLDTYDAIELSIF